jgi:hypothetical protein
MLVWNPRLNTVFTFDLRQDPTGFMVNAVARVQVFLPVLGFPLWPSVHHKCTFILYSSTADTCRPTLILAIDSMVKHKIFSRFFYSPTDSQVNCLKNNFKVYIKIDIKTAPACSHTIIRERITRNFSKHKQFAHWWWWCDCTETCRSCFIVNFNVNFKIVFKTFTCASVGE